MSGTEELAARLAPQIRARLGLLIHEHQHEELAQAVAEAARRFGYGSPRHLADSFEQLNDTAPELNHLVARITVGESYFFRDAAQMAWLRDEFLPGLLRERRAAGELGLRIWSAAASQGQELYSVAMLLHEQLSAPGHEGEAWNLHLLGSDINTEGLATALAGGYREWSLRGVDTAQRERHFERIGLPGEGPLLWQVSPSVRAMTRFTWLNLAGEAFPSVLTDTHAMDLILCRNVFIYFDPAVARRILARLVQCLAPGGVLLLGPSDIVDARIDGLVQETRPGMFLYRKPPEATPAVPAGAPARPAATGMPAAPATPAAPGPRERHERPESHARRDPTAPHAPAAPSEPPPSLRQLSDARRWPEIVAREPTLPPPLSAEQLLQLAAAHGNLGRHAEALHRCERALALAPADEQAHFLRALLLLETGDGAEARSALRRALFLDPGFVAAHYQLGMLQLADGQREPGVRSLTTALTLAQRRPPSLRLPGAPELTAGQLAEILRHELQLQGERQ